MNNKNFNNENHPSYFTNRIQQLCKELDIKKIIGFGTKFADKKIDEKKILFSFPCLSYTTKYDTDNIYTLVFPLGLLCMSKKEEEIAKDLDNDINDCLQSHSFSEISVAIETSVRHFEPYRQLYALLEQVTAFQVLKKDIAILRMSTLQKENEELKQRIEILQKENAQYKKEKTVAKKKKIESVFSQSMYLNDIEKKENETTSYWDFHKVKM